MDPVYEAMCEKAHQLQVLKLNLGTYDSYDVVLNKKTGIRLMGLQLLDMKPSEDTHWLPTQQQIQTILLKLHNSIPELMELVVDYVDELYREFPQRQDITMEQVWIMFYMEKVHAMYWCRPCNNWKALRYKVAEGTAPLQS